MKRGSIALLGGLAVVLALIGCLLAAPFTAAGTRLLVAVLDRLEVLELDYHSGTIAGSLQLGRLLVSADDAIVTLDDVTVTPDWRCLSIGELCLQQLSARRLDVEVILSDDEEQIVDDEESNPFWPLPRPLASDAIAIGQLRVHWDGGELTSERISGATRIVGDQIQVLGGRAHVTRLDIPDPGGDDGPLEELITVDLPLELVVVDTTLFDSVWEIHDSRNVYDELSAAGYWRGVELVVETAEVVNREWGRASLAGELRFVHPYTMDFETTIEATTPPIWEGLHGARGELRLSGGLTEYRVRGEICGHLPVTVDAVVDVIGEGFPTRLHITEGCGSESSVLFIADTPGLSGAPDVSLSPGWEARLVGDLTAQQVSAQGRLSGYGYEGVQLEVSGSHRDGRVVLDHLRAVNGKEKLALQGEIGLGEEFGWRLAATLEAVALPAQLAPLEGWLGGTFQTTGRWRDEDWQVALQDTDLRGEVNGLPAEMSGRLQLDQDMDPLGSEFQLLLNGAEAALTTAQGTPRAVLSVADAGRWLEGAEGALETSLEWDQRGRSLSLEAGSRDLKWGGLRVRELGINGRLAYGDGERFELHAAAAPVLVGESRAAGLKLSLVGTSGEHRLDGALSGDVSTRFSLDGSLGEDGWRGRLLPLVVNTESRRIALEQTMALRFDAGEGQLRLADHCWLGDRDTRVCSEGTVLGRSGQTELAVAGDLEVLSELLPEGFSLGGKVAVDVDARWEDLEVETLRAGFRMGEGRLQTALAGGEQARFGWEQATLEYQGGLQAGRLKGRFRRGGADNLVLDLTMPATFDGPLAGTVSLAQLDLANIKPFIPRLRELRGALGGELQFSGRVNAPRVNGRVFLQDGRMALLGNPTEVDGIDLQALFLGDRAELSGDLSVAEGRSEMSGQLSWLDGARLTLALQGDEKTLLYPTDTVVRASEDLLLELSPERIRLTGEIVVPSGEIVLDGLDSGGVDVSDDVLLFNAQGERVGEENLPTAVDIDLNIRIRNRLLVTADGISGRVGGDLRLRQPPGRPLQLHGRIDVVEGRFELLGPRFDVTRGQLAFVGVPDNPQLAIALEREIPEDQVTVGIRVGGNLELPKLEFYSRPALPEAEVMSYALSGRGIDRSGAGDNLGLALAMTSGLMKSAGFMERVSLGVEGRDRDSRAVIGGYISDRIYLSYGVGLYDPVNVLTVRMDIIRRLWFEVVSSIRSSADLYYSWSR